MLISCEQERLCTSFVRAVTPGTHLLHSFSDIPVHKGTLGVHEIELVVDTRESLGNGGGVGNHAHGTLDTSEISCGHDGWRLVVDTALRKKCV